MILLLIIDNNYEAQKQNASLENEIPRNDGREN